MSITLILLDMVIRVPFLLILIRIRMSIDCVLKMEKGASASLSKSLASVAFVAILRSMICRILQIQLAINVFVLCPQFDPCL